MMSDQTFDHDLRDYATKGCPVAFRRLVERHIDAVHATARRVLGQHAHLAADVSQSVFIRLARMAAGLPRGVIVSAWLHRQTVRLALNTVRAQSRRRVREAHAADLQTMNHSSADEGWNEIRPHLDMALLQLCKADQEALALRFFEKRGLREVGQALGVSTDAAQKRIERALEKLRLRLGSHVRLGVPLASLSGLMNTRAVEAAASSLGDAVATHALASAGAPSTFAAFMALVTHAKGLAFGTVLGLAAGGVWWAASPVPFPTRTQALPLSDSRPFNSNPGPPRLNSQSDPVPKRRANVVSVFAQLQEMLIEPENELSRLRLRAVMEQLTSEEFAPLLALIEKEMPDEGRGRLLSELARVWAVLAPASALQQLIGVRAAPFAHPQELARLVFTTWNTRAPRAAQEWLVEHQNDRAFANLIRHFIETVATGLAQQSESAALEWAAQLDGDEYRIAALTPLWAGFMEAEDGADRFTDLKRLFTSIESQADPDSARLGIRTLSQNWAKFRPAELQRLLSEAQPGPLAWEAALAYVGSHESITVRDGRYHSTSITPQERVDRAALALRLAPGLTNTQAVSRITARIDHMTREYREWALPLLNGPERDAAILSAARRAMPPKGSWIRSREPARVALEWAVELSDPQIRDPLIYGIFQEWLTQEPDAAKSFQGRQDWPEPLRAILEKAEQEL